MFGFTAIEGEKKPGELFLTPAVSGGERHLLLKQSQRSGWVHSQVLGVWLTIVGQVSWPVPYHEQVQELQRENRASGLEEQPEIYDVYDDFHKALYENIFL